MITLYLIEVNGVNCQLYLIEQGGISSFIQGLDCVEFSSNDPYYDLCVVEEWLTLVVIDVCRKHDKLLDDDNNVVIELFVLDVIKYAKID